MNTLTFTALAEPNRLRIVELLRERPRSVGEIAERLGLRQPQVSKHLHTLTGAGLTKVQPDAQRRIYRLEPQAFAELEIWVAGFRKLWDERYDALDDVLAKLQDEQPPD